MRSPRPFLLRPAVLATTAVLLLSGIAGASYLAQPPLPVPGADPPHAAECPVADRAGDGSTVTRRARTVSLGQSEGEGPEWTWEEGQPEDPNAEYMQDSKGCLSANCHVGSEPSHARPRLAKASCVRCHGGDGSTTNKEKAHVAPRYPALWETIGNPQRSYELLNRESPEYIQFVNPGDLRVADRSCGGAACHADIVVNVKKSPMTHGSFLYGAALYNNGQIPLKDTVLGESYARNGTPQRINGFFPGEDDALRLPTPQEQLEKGWLTFLDPLPRWEISQVGNPFRAFEEGGFRKREGEIGNPVREEENGRPDIKLSFRGHGTFLRTDPTVLGAQKTRLFDPTLNFLGTNDHPGDYRSSGCTSCHVVYANDKDFYHSGPYAQFGNLGISFTKDAALEAYRTDDPKRGLRGRPITHRMTNGMPTSQCMTCHMHPGTNMLTTYLGYTWWDNETDGELLYPPKERPLSARERDAVERRNPEGAALKGRWGDPAFLEQVSELNARLRHTQFGNSHGHGWIYRAVYKRDRKGNLLDRDGKIVPFDDPRRFDKNNPAAAVHLQDIHLEKGMHCVDCHFKQDVHGTGKLYNEPRAAIEITCEDCHGSVRKKAELVTAFDDATASGPAGRKHDPPNGTDLALLTVPFLDEAGDFFPRFELRDGKLYQRSAVMKDAKTGRPREWEVPQVLDTITPGNPRYSEKARLAKTIRRDARTWGTVPESDDELAHADSTMTCYACHSSWTTACFGCHLSMTANQKKPNLHNEGGNSRNWTSYNFQTLRDDLYMLGKDGNTPNFMRGKRPDGTVRNRTAPIRSSCAVLVSSQNANRQWIYYQQQTISAEGFSGTAFSSYVPHTVRGKETKQCTDCHLSDRNDNNAWISNLLLLGSNAVNFIGRYAYVATEHGFQAVTVAEREEPAAVIGSTLHRMAYPDRYARHQRRGRELKVSHDHHGHTLHLQLRGEYLYAAEGPRGLWVYDVANVDNKDFSERIVTAPVSPLGQRFYVKTRYATAVASPSTMTIDGGRTQLPQNQEGKVHPLYNYLYVTDRHEGLVVVGPVITLFDGNPRNNFLKRAATWNPDGLLNGASYLELAGNYAYVTTPRSLVVVDLSQPTRPRLAAEVTGLVRPTSVTVQFRYAFVTDAEGLKVVDVTEPEKPVLVANAVVPLKEAHRVYVSRTYAYVAAGSEGLAIIDVENPESPKLDQLYDAGGALNDSHDVKVGMTNNSTFAYVADGKNGLRVVQLTSPDRTPGIYGFSPRPSPELIATYRTSGPAVAVSEGLDRDRAVDESGNQLAVFGRRGARPFNLEEQRRMYRLADGTGPLFKVSDQPPGPPLEPPPAAEEASEALSWADVGWAVPLLAAGWLLRRRFCRWGSARQPVRSA